MEQPRNASRRNFLRLSSLGIAGGFLSHKLHGQTGNDENNQEKPITRTLGKTGIELPVVSLGVMRVDNPNLVKLALRGGMTHLDTAYKYQNGQNEKMLGEILQDYDRASYTIASKTYMPRDRTTGNLTGEAMAELVLEQLNESLERLQLDHVDILYHHAIDNRGATLNEEVMKGLAEAKKQGKAKHIGVSTHSNEPEVIRAAIESDFYEVVLTAYNYLQPHRDEVKKAIAEAHAAGLGVVAMKTMAGGFKDKEREVPVNATAALKWALQDENVHTSIPGCTSFDQVEENLAVMKNLELTAAEEEELAALTDQRLYCSGCRECVPQCKKQLPVPEIMRAYMYNYGYGDPKLAYQEILESGIPDAPCADCTVCTVQCPVQFNVAQKISDIARLKKVPLDFLS
jgi:hypothetical protein